MLSVNIDYANNRHCYHDDFYLNAKNVFTIGEIEYELDLTVKHNLGICYLESLLSKSHTVKSFLGSMK